MFELQEVTKVTITNANPRRELHGEEKVRGIDITFNLTGENTLLDLLKPGLRDHHYTNHALTAGQESLPNVIVPLPNLRFPELPRKYDFAKGENWRGYRFVWDWGLEGAHVDFTDVVLTGLHYELHEGGSVKVAGTIQYNGDELQDNDVYGELSGLTSEGDIHIQLIAPGEAMPVKKGYRAGRPDTTQTEPADERDAGDIFADTHGEEEREEGQDEG